MSKLASLRLESRERWACCFTGHWLMAEGFREHFAEPVPLARAYAVERLFTGCPKHIYKNDVIAGSMHGYFTPWEPIAEEYEKESMRILNSYGVMTFSDNSDHFAPGYDMFLADGIGGTLERIARSKEAHKEDADAEKKLTFLQATEITMRAFQTMVEQYADEAKRMAELGEDNAEMMWAIEDSCRRLVTQPPRTFRDALQLVWLTQIAFRAEERMAMAYGRMDQYLYPYYQCDVEAGILTPEMAREMLECTFIKIAEQGLYNICNIVIGGVKRDGTGGVNPVSYLIVEAVKNCNVPGPNLSARYYEGIPDDFLDLCLQSIGTGLGYPALMNDATDIPALHRLGYSLEDSRDYCMVGCIEDFLAGKQPPWSDGRYNTPKFLELALNDGVCMQTGVRKGPSTGDPADFASMEELIAAFRTQMEAGAREYVAFFRNQNDRYNRVNYCQPFLSCFCECCIDRALDVNDGGTVYPSVHGAGCMGIATVSDSLAAVERVIFEKKLYTMAQLHQALLDNFEGHEEMRQELLRAPKYGNNDDYVDKYAVWFVEVHDEIFSQYRTRDGGHIYTGIASNIDNIPAGLLIAATPNGRRNAEPVSDAASPSQGMDKRGPTAVVQSTSKPDFKRVSCGTVLNQKYTPDTFTDPNKRAKLMQLIKTYFQLGGQEIQINCVSREILQDAMEHPEKYPSLVVRVSGFSNYYTALSREVQEDILERTEHGR